MTMLLLLGLRIVGSGGVGGGAVWRLWWVMRPWLLYLCMCLMEDEVGDGLGRLMMLCCVVFLC